MISQSLLAYSHYFSFLLVVGTLITELFVFRQVLSPADRKILQRADALYGLGAILVLITGFIRVFYGGKGGDYYFSNYIFLTKLGLFTLVGILSIYPTVVFLKWPKKADPDLPLELENGQFLKIRRMIRIEVLLVFLLPLLAALMARGMGYFG